jgi:hypothetical protein
MLTVQSKTLSNTKWRFEIQLSKLYTRGVFKEFEERMVNVTAYGFATDPEGGEHDFLVHHTNKHSKITWGQHQFKVRVDKELEDYTCECKEWEHTGTTVVRQMWGILLVELEYDHEFISCRSILCAPVACIHAAPS